MPSPIIVLDLIKSSLRLARVLAAGETPNADEANDSLLVLNDMLEDWSTERLAVWGAANETFTTVGGQATYTIGPSGNFNTARPVRIADAYCTFGGVDFHIDMVNQEQYNLIAIKSMQQPIVEQMLYVNDFPLGRITLWPVPTAAIPLVLSTDRVLTSPVTLATSLSGPPGYLKALRYSLAVELAAEFGMEAPATVLGIALDSKRNYKAANQTPVVARCDDALVADPVALYPRGY